MLEFIKDADSQLKFNVEVFGGSVIFEVRALSPIEAEAAGLSSSMVAANAMSGKQLAKMMKQREKIEDINMEEPSDSDMEILLNILDGFKPEQLLSIEEQQNKIICTVVTRASEDGGKTFERIHLVTGYDQQDPENNRLWVGMLPKEDREAIMSKAMNAHKEAVESLNSFRRTG